MIRNIRQVEQKVSRVIEQLKDSRGRREGLQAELQTLRERLESLEAEQVGAAALPEDVQDWQSQRNEALKLIHTTLAEFRES